MKKKIFQESVWSFSSKGIGIFLFLLNSSVLAHILGKEVFGEWMVIFSFFSLCHFFSLFGVNDFLRKELVQANSIIYRNIVQNFLPARILISFLSGILILLMLFIFGVPFHSISPRIIFIFLVPFLLFYGILDFLHQVFFGVYRIQFSFFLSVVEQTSFLFFLIVFSFFGEFSLFSIFSFHLFSFGLAISFGTFFFWKLTSSLEKSPLFFERTIFSIFSSSIPYCIVQAGTYFFVYIDILLLGIFTSPMYAGAYGIAKNVIAKVPHINGALSLSFSPVFSQFTKRDINFQKKKRILFQYILFNIILLLGVSLGILLFSKTFVLLIWGNQYDNVAFFLKALIPYMVSFSLLSAIGAILDYNNAIGKRSVIYVFSAFLFFLLFFCLPTTSHHILIALSLSCAIASFSHFFVLFQTIFSKDTPHLLRLVKDKPRS